MQEKNKRKKPNRSRKNDIHLFLNEYEMKKLSIKSKDVDMNMSEYIRNVIINGNVIVKHLDFIDCKELIRHFSRIGTNINQIARNVNQYGNVDKFDVEILGEQVNILQSFFIEELLKFQTSFKSIE